MSLNSPCSVCAVCEKWLEGELNSFKCSGCQLSFCSRACEKQSNNMAKHGGTNHDEFCMEVTDTLNDAYMWEEIHSQDVDIFVPSKAKKAPENKIVGNGLCLVEDVKKHDVICRMSARSHDVSFKHTSMETRIDFDKLDNEIDGILHLPNTLPYKLKTRYGVSHSDDDGIYANSPMPLIELLVQLEKGRIWNAFVLLQREYEMANAFVAYKGGDMFLVARQDLKKGEFVNIAYGHNFWMTAIAFGRFYNTRFTKSIWRMQDWLMKSKSWPAFLGTDCTYKHKKDGYMIRHTDAKKNHDNIGNCIFKTLRYRLRYIGENHDNIEKEIESFVLVHLAHVFERKGIIKKIQGIKTSQMIQHILSEN